MICNEILYFDLMYMFFRGKGLNQNLEIGLISVNIINHKEITDLYIYKIWMYISLENMRDMQKDS